MLVFQWKVPAKEFFLKVAGCFLPTAILPKTNFFRMFFFIFEKSVDQSLLDDFFYLLLSLKLFSQKKPVLLKLSHLITLVRWLDQSNEIHFASSWPLLIIKGRCNTLFKWHLVKCHFDFNCLPLDFWQIFKKHLRRK